MKKEFDLSKKFEGYIAKPKDLVKDVKEFIKLIKKPRCICHLFNINKCGSCLFIDKLAGEELTK